MIALKCTMITVTVALSLTFGAPASAHDCPKTGNQHKTEAGSMGGARARRTVTQGCTRA